MDQGVLGPWNTFNYGAAKSSLPAHSSPRSRLNINFLTINIPDNNFFAINQKVNRPTRHPQTRSGRLARLSVRGRSSALVCWSANVGGLRQIQVVVLYTGMAKIEPLIAGHTAGWPETDCRHQPVQASAAVEKQCMTLATRAGKRGR